MMTTEQRAVLAHVVIDPDAWLDHAVAALGTKAAQSALETKVSRWRPRYEQERTANGASYQTRAQRDAALSL